MPTRRVLLIAVAVLAVAAAAALPALRWVLWRKELNPVLRGRLLAEEVGCMTCHRPFGRGEIPNPGSRWASVPRFAAGNALMYAANRREIEEFIRLGAPMSWLMDPEAGERLDQQRVRMPAYGETLSQGQIDDLTVFAAAVEGVEPAGGEEAVRGRELARAKGCLACHGIEGSGGMANPGSMGGFVPGFLGGNYPDLVRDEAEFGEWVREGTSSRLASSFWIGYFWRRQLLSMPAYGDSLTDEELGLLWTWVEAARAGPGDSSVP